MTEAIAVAAVCITVLAVLISGMAWVDKYACMIKAEKMEMEYSWGMVQGCMIKVQGKWIPLNKYRVMD